MMTRAEEVAWGTQVRSLVATGYLSAAQGWIAENLFFRLRVKGRDRTQATIKLMAAKFGVSRDAVMEALRKCQAAGVLEKLPTYIRRAIGALVRPCRG